MDWTLIYNRTRRSPFGVTGDPVLERFKFYQYSRHTGISESQQHGVPFLYKDLLGFTTYLEDHTTQTMFLGETQSFLPKSILDKLTTAEVILEVLESLYDAHGHQRLDKLAKDNFETQRKMFLTCLHGGVGVGVFFNMIHSGREDRQMPLTIEDWPEVESDLEWRDNFVKCQKHFLAAFSTPSFLPATGLELYGAYHIEFVRVCRNEQLRESL